MTKLKRSCFGHIMSRQGSLEKPRMLGKTEGSRKRGRCSMRWMVHITKAIGVGLREVSGAVGDRALWTLSDLWTLWTRPPGVRLTQWHGAHNGQHWCLACSVQVVDRNQGFETPGMDSSALKCNPVHYWVVEGCVHLADFHVLSSLVSGNTEIWKIQFMFSKTIEFRAGDRLCMLASNVFDKGSTKLKLNFINIEYTI